MNQLMLWGYNAPATQVDESRNRRHFKENGKTTVQDSTAFSLPAALEVPISTSTGTLDSNPSDLRPRHHHRKEVNLTSPVSDPSLSTVSTVLDTIPAYQHGGRHHHGDVISLQSGVVLDSPFRGTVTQGLNVREGTPLADPLPGPSTVPEPGSPGLALAALAVAGIMYRKSAAKAQQS